MTARTLAYLNSTLLGPSQAAGSITPARMQDIVDTMNARTGGNLGGGSFVRVTDPEFGADPTGVANSTTAFQNAMAAGPCIVPALTPAGAIATYALSNCVVPNGATLIGGSGMGYVGESDAYVRPQIVPFGAATRIFNVDSKFGIKIQGLYINCIAQASSCDAISAGCVSLTLQDNLIAFANHGVGGQVSGSTATYPSGIWIGNFVNNSISNCLTGVSDLVDCFIFGGTLTTCSNGWLTTNAGVSSSTSWNGTRFEQCGRVNPPGPPFGGGSGYGANMVAGTTSCTFNGCSFDANGLGAMYFDGCSGISVNGCEFTRNGCNTTTGTTLVTTSCHVEFNGANHILFTTCTSDFNSGNDGFVFSPAAFAHFDGAASNNTGILFVNNDLSGYQGSTAGATQLGPVSSATLWRTGTAPTGTGLNGYVVSKNLGTGAAASDVDTR